MDKPLLIREDGTAPVLDENGRLLRYKQDFTLDTYFDWRGKEGEVEKKYDTTSHLIGIRKPGENDTTLAKFFILDLNGKPRFFRTVEDRPDGSRFTTNYNLEGYITATYYCPNKYDLPRETSQYEYTYRPGPGGETQINPNAQIRINTIKQEGPSSYRFSEKGKKSKEYRGIISEAFGELLSSTEPLSPITENLELQEQTRDLPEEPEQAPPIESAEGETPPNRY